MLSKKHAALAAFIAMAFMASTALSACGGGESISVSSADVSTVPIAGEDSNTTDGAVEPQPVDKPSAPEPQDESKEASSATGSSHNSGTADKDDSYFNDAVFIGDSLTEGFQLHGGLTGPTYYGFKNLNVKEVFDKSLVKSDSGKITIADALRKNSFEKYYIMLGANELGWVYPEVFTKKYGELIDLIREKNPDAKIYLQSILPVSAETSRTNQYYSNDRINYYDELISALAAEKSVTYLNVRESVQNEAGILPDEAATDGVHLNKDYCLKWADYLRDHK